MRKVAVHRHDGFFWEERGSELYPMRDEDYRIACVHFIRELQRNNLTHTDPTSWRISIRMVVPGTYYTEHRVVDDAFVASLIRDRVRDPAHIDPLLTELAVLREAFPGITILAVSDSAFHHTIPSHARRIALPESVCAKYDLGVYGYHGLVLSSIVRQLQEGGMLPHRTIVCHLGNGASVTALLDGVSVTTSMGYSPLEGLPMGTRSGDVPLGAVLELLRTMPYEDVVEMLYGQSGLYALSGYTSDMEVLVRDKESNEQACVALETYVYRVASTVSTQCVALGGVDLIVFSGGIGERSAYVREMICKHLAFLGVKVDTEHNTMSETRTNIAHQDSRVQIVLLHPDEESEMMRV